MSIDLSAEAILEAVREADMSRREVGELLKLSPSQVSLIFSGRRRLSLEEANQLLSKLPPRTNMRDLPLIGLAGAGNWVEAIESTKLQVQIPRDPHVEGQFGVEVVGHSMNLLLPEGSIAIVDPEETTLYSSRVYLLLNAEGEATIKRYRSDPARFEPVSDDPSYEPFLVGASDFRVIGRITFAMSRL